ncbi:DUF6449 domain-containing protein [Faecalicatena orotica]|uniref:DUF6449 domain-containing protein n=1 Tax=Faecalicatena orotica TaxID=1544 RepID=UPI0032171CB3
MTSKISYFKFIEADIRNRGWLAALTAVFTFLLMPVYTMITLDTMKHQSSGDGQSLKWISELFPQMLNGTGRRPLSIFILVIAVLCAVSGFAYLHSREKQDFYHGMPLSRMQWFTISYAGGLLIFLVPYLLFGLCTILLGYANGLMTGNIPLLCVSALLGGILGFLICYHVSILAMFLTGRIVTGVLASLVLLVYGTVILSLFDGLSDQFFATWYNGMPTGFIDKLQSYSSPALLYTKVLRGSTASPSSPALIICSVITALLFLGAALFVYRHYPAEAAENALAFRSSAPVIKVLITVPTSLFLGMFIISLKFYGSVRWLIITSILAAVLLCMLIEFIYHRDLAKLLSGKASSGISVGAVIVILCILQFDLFGYDSYLPPERRLDNMSVYADLFSGYFTYPENIYSLSYDQLTAKNAAFTDYAPLYQLAKDGIQNVQDKITPQTVDYESSSYNYLSISVRYGMKNGRDIYRRYAVDRTGLLNTLSKLCENKDYRRELFPVFHLDKDDVLKVSVQDLYYQPMSLPLSREQQNELLEAYEKDVLAADIADLQYESPLGELVLEILNTYPEQDIYAGENTAQLGQFYIYKSYTGTLKLLHDYGITLREKIAPEDVTSITYYPNIDGQGDLDAKAYIKEYTSGAGITITDPAKIGQILKKIDYDECSGILGSRQTAAGSVEIILAGQAYPNVYIIPEAR